MEGNLVAPAPAWDTRGRRPQYPVGERHKVCVCGWHTADAACSSVRALQQRGHVFWSCPRAQSILGLLAENLPSSFAMLPSHVWLLIPPSPRINSQVWWVACLCVLTAILKLRHTDQPSLKERCTNFVFLGLQDFVACQGQHSP